MGCKLVNTSHRAMDIYWATWFAVSITFFLVPELLALFSGHPENTLSDAIWRMEAARTGQPIYQWTFAHFAFTGGFLLLAIWLTGHFGWRIWT